MAATPPPYYSISVWSVKLFVEDCVNHRWSPVCILGHISPKRDTMRALLEFLTCSNAKFNTCKATWNLFKPGDSGVAESVEMGVEMVRVEWGKPPTAAWLEATVTILRSPQNENRCNNKGRGRPGKENFQKCILAGNFKEECIWIFGCPEAL